MRLANTTSLADLSNMTVTFLSADNRATLLSTPVSFFATGDSRHMLLFTENKITIPQDRFYVVASGLHRQTPFQVGLEPPIVPQSLEIVLKPSSDNFLEDLTNFIQQVSGLGHLAPFVTVPLNRTSDVEFTVRNRGDRDMRVSFSVDSQVHNNHSVFDDFNLTLPDPVFIPAGGSADARFEITPRSGLPHNSTYRIIVAAHNADANVEANFVQAELQFVGCDNCPQEIGTCEFINGTYQCNCYLGLTEGPCSRVERNVKRTATTLAVGVIIAIVLGSIACIGLALLLGYCFCVRPLHRARAAKAASVA
jgi:hypothetical protein